jgi:hypothetical protein
MKVETASKIINEIYEAMKNCDDNRINVALLRKDCAELMELLCNLEV